MRDLPPTLYIPILDPCQSKERLVVMVHANNGYFVVSLNNEGMIILFCV